MRLRDAAPDDARCAAVLDFWFGLHADDADVAADRNPVWFRGGADVDASIRLHFGALREMAITGELDDWLARARGRLALVILVDQFSRNLFRNDARAFAHDALARGWCEQALERGMDQSLRPIERVFLYLPLEHAETLAAQERSVALFEALHDDASGALRDTFASYLDYARRHRDIIARFGRFPHRNEALGRASTSQETQFLAAPGSSF